MLYSRVEMYFSCLFMRCRLSHGFTTEMARRIVLKLSSDAGESRPTGIAEFSFLESYSVEIP
jgi:hypothetical protein